MQILYTDKSKPNSSKLNCMYAWLRIDSVITRHIWVKNLLIQKNSNVLYTSVSFKRVVNSTNYTRLITQVFTGQPVDFILRNIRWKFYASISYYE